MRFSYECTCLPDWFVLVAGPPVPRTRLVPSQCPPLLSALHLRKVVDMWASWNMSSILIKHPRLFTHTSISNITLSQVLARKIQEKSSWMKLPFYFITIYLFIKSYYFFQFTILQLFLWISKEMATWFPTLIWIAKKYFVLTLSDFFILQDIKRTELDSSFFQ